MIGLTTPTLAAQVAIQRAIEPAQTLGGGGWQAIDNDLWRRLDTGVLVLFDRRPEAPPVAERTHFEEATSPSGRAITVLRA